MSGASNFTLENIDAVDAFANQLYLRSSNPADPGLFDVASTVRQLHLALRQIRIEAADPDSLLSSAADASLYARQLRPIIEDCGFALKQLEAVLDKYGDGTSDPHAAVQRADRLAAVRSKLANERTNVDMFLDTVQLHSSAQQRNGGAYEGASQTSLEGIKDKVDAIAQRLFSRRDSGIADCHDDDGLWQQFKVELEKEGFSPEVLHRHKDILRAYIRELESMTLDNGGAPPTVRGLLEYEARSAPPPPKEVIGPNIDNEKCIPSMKHERRMPDHAPIDPPPPTLPRGVAQDEHSSAGSDDLSSDVSGESMALISTRDLVTMDGVTANMANMQLQPHQHLEQAYSYGSSPRSSQKYLTSHAAAVLPASVEAQLSSSPSAKLGSSPRSVPHWSQHVSSTGNGPMSMDGHPQRISRLGPDRYGNEIPMDAQWTRIRRTVVSPEVLQRAGVRYEARPDFVAVLGRLSPEQIREFARQSIDCRAARTARYSQPPRKHEEHRRDRADSKSSREEDDEGSVLWDESDTTDCDDDRTSDKGTRSYPYIVNPPGKDKTSPNSATLPKPILKNKNENHVRFDPQPHEVESKSPHSYKDEYSSSSHRRKDGTRYHRESNRDNRYGDRRSGNGDYSSSSSRRNGERERERHGDYHRSSHHRDKRGGDRRDKKKAWGETLGAVGIGGAAASLLGVLAEAAGSV